ncbi:DNA-processing protein DprA [Calidifontibacter sp. DB0510]|uniref:DNA-processing protein DprA n=1 Tax=Metallococcus carri TaxID=1656884 RepID=A0A967EA24_9MICO|nr:DNA-processing protein DprA [Metallococcus carri]NHN55830.1 DNA-processing protein DprA [Metallococcus carri]NOP38482.1 DNA-protecting protein DprA [Calidifontibacter sp. DB2511S]
MTTSTTTHANDVLALVANSDRTARIALACGIEPGNRLAGYLTQQHGPVGLIRLIVGADQPDPTQPYRDETRRLLADAARRLTLDALTRITEQNAHMLTPSDADWPEPLIDLGHAQPFALWVHGNTDALGGSHLRRVALVGSRAATAYGEHTATTLADGLAQRGYTVVADGGYGIAAAAHRATLAATGCTVAVLACGTDRPFPPGNATLFQHITDTGGALVSELPPGTGPTRHRFTTRARLIAALCATTVVVEASARSTALRIAEHALSMSRTVAGVPGPVTSITSTGVHRLIQDGETHLVTTAEDITDLIPTG